MTELFIEKAKKIHGDNYDYSKTEYKKAAEKVIIICKIHGEFLITPNSHIHGTGCGICGGKYQSNTCEFIEKAKKIHGDKYDYSKIEYKKAKEKVIIICKTHGDFIQTPSDHLHNYGCRICGFEKMGNLKSNTTEFIEKAKQIHGDTYDYSKTDYKKAIEKVIIICKTHGEFLLTPNKHLNGRVCQLCSKNCFLSKVSDSKEDFLNKSKEIHGDKYDYSIVEYKNNNTPITILCKTHGEFSQLPSVHKTGSGCQKCGNNYRYDTKEFIEKSIEVHGNKYDYSKTEYKKNNEKVIIICNAHGNFEQKPNNHLLGNGCPICNPKYSKPQIQWLNFIQLYNNITIKHAENGGEFKIPNTNYKSDGYCEETNTIYEFHGDYWHGNPNKFISTEINNSTKTTFGDLYQTTLEREQQIRDLGYNLVVMWERDWNKINKSIRVLQRKFKSLH
jgi:hypothetical protein